MASGGQRLVPGGQGGSIMVARPQGQQPQMIPGGQIVRASSGILLGTQRPGAPLPSQMIRPGLPTAPASSQGVQNVVIRQNGARPGLPGAQITVPLSTLQGLQAGQGIPTGQPGHLLVKTETGQYQILRVGPPGQQQQPQHQQPQQHHHQQNNNMNNINPTTVSVSPVAVTSHTSHTSHQTQQVVRPPVVSAVTSTPIMRPTSAPTTVNQIRHPVTPLTAPNAPTPATIRQSMTNSNAVQSNPPNANTMGQQMTPDTAKIKCKNFLATLLRLASDQPEGVARNVRSLIQGLIDGRVEPEVFTTNLQKELNSSPQPCLVPFLKKSLPYLQQSLATQELTIDGVHPPSLSQVGKLPPAMNQTQPVRISAPSVLPTPPTPRPPQPQPQPVLPQQPVQPPPPTPPIQPPTQPSHPTPPTHPTQLPVPTRQITPRAPITRPGLQIPPPVTVADRVTEFPSAPTNINRPGLTLAQNQSNLSKPNALPVIRDKKSSNSYSAAGDDDINDVAAMGGVNLQEEANKILGSSDNVGTVIRSCKDETFLQTGLLHQKISRICKEKGLESPTAEVIGLISHATQDRLKTLVSKLSVIAEHRLDMIKTEGPYEVTDDIKGQIRFLEDLDKMEKKKQEEMERELLIRAAKSRTKTDDPEKEKMKAKAKELQRIEQEQQRHSEANATALAAIGGPKSKKFKFDENNKMGGAVPIRPRTKRVHLRDVIFLMEQEKDLRHSPLLFRSYCS